ncbi:MAG TPA: hypothetical protein VFH47_03820 [Candidatus Thermoplasmatota archaeon]|nr:hypothetical protein [Candidatus Thermoplasmatota archaeon]
MHSVVPRPPAPRPATRPAPPPPARGFDLPPLVYTTLAVGYGLFALGQLLLLVVFVRDVPELSMEAVARVAILLGAIVVTAALVFGGGFGRGIPGWARVVLVAAGAYLVVLGLGSDVFLGLDADTLEAAA